MPGAGHCGPARCEPGQTEGMEPGRRGGVPGPPGPRWGGRGSPEGSGPRPAPAPRGGAPAPAAPGPRRREGLAEPPPPAAQRGYRSGARPAPLLRSWGFPAAAAAAPRRPPASRSRGGQGWASQSGPAGPRSGDAAHVELAGAARSLPRPPPSLRRPPGPAPTAVAGPGAAGGTARPSAPARGAPGKHGEPGPAAARVAACSVQPHPADREEPQRRGKPQPCTAAPGAPADLRGATGAPPAALRRHRDRRPGGTGGSLPRAAPGQSQPWGLPAAPSPPRPELRG